MRVIVDTNVPVVANATSPQASPTYVLACADRIREIVDRHTLVLDDAWLVLREYLGSLHSSGQPGIGDAFLKWVLTNWINPTRCECIHLAIRARASGEMSDREEFEAFPDDDDLAGFDPSDRKFVALCLTHPERPPILNAVDTDWWMHREVLGKHGVRLEFLCPDDVRRLNG